MSCSAVLVAIATLFLAQGSFAQTTQAINRLVPVTAKIQSSLSIGASYEVTPTAPLRKRRLAERIRDDMESEDLSSTRRKLLALPHQTSGPPCTLPQEFITLILNALLNPSNSTRKLLQTSQRLTFYGSIKEQLLTEQASAVYIFNEDSRSFLQTATKSGSTFTFLKALLILPQEQTSTVVPPSVSSTTGFLSTKPSEPVIVRLSTLGSSSGVVPNVALRFDYASKVPGTTPFFSLYFSDLVGAYPKGVPKANLAQTYGIYVGEDGTIYPGQQGR